jgi:hypothetical protein
MFTYPQLSTVQSQNLPRLISQPKQIQAKFTDSTHHIWLCDTSDGLMVLKVCNLDSILESDFWFAMNDLFNFDFPLSLGSIQASYQLLDENGHFRIPKLIASEANAYVLTEFLSGVDLDAGSFTTDDVVNLGVHLGQLHQQTYSSWGAIAQSEMTSDRWPLQLAQTLSELVKKTSLSIPNALLEQALIQARTINIQQFVPIMLDLRWDQLRKLTDGSIALVDLDAIVLGPAALDLVLVEYLVDEKQYYLFKETYCQYSIWPAIQDQKICYQLLLFLMNVLGETDIDRWMNH